MVARDRACRFAVSRSTQVSGPHQVVRGGSEGKDPADLSPSAVPGLAHSSHRLHPAEDLFDSFPGALTLAVSRVPRRPCPGLQTNGRASFIPALPSAVAHCARKREPGAAVHGEDAPEGSKAAPCSRIAPRTANSRSPSSTMAIALERLEGARDRGVPAATVSRSGSGRHPRARADPTEPAHFQHPASARGSSRS